MRMDTDSRSGVLRTWAWALALGALAAAWAGAQPAYMIKDMSPGTSSSLAATAGARFVSIDPWVYFAATDGTSGVELYKLQEVESIASSPERVEDISSGSGSSSPTYLTVMDGAVYFAATDGGGPGKYGREVWKTSWDGSSQTTSRVTEINTDGDSNPQYLTTIEVDDSPGALGLFYSASDGTDVKLWWTDEAGATAVIPPLDAEDPYFEPEQLTPVYFGNTAGWSLFFVARLDSATGGKKLWRVKVDATYGDRKAELITSTDFSGYLNPDHLYWMPGTNGVVFFAAYDTVNGTELWRSDGTAGGTWPLYTDVEGLDPADLIEMDGELFFTATTDELGREIWATYWDSELGEYITDPVTDINSETGDSTPSDLRVVTVDSKSYLYFAATDGGGTGYYGREIYSLTWDDTQYVATRRSDINSSGDADPEDLTAVLYSDTFTRLFFSAYSDGTSQRQLWMVDTSTLAVSALQGSEAPNSNPQDFVPVSLDGDIFLLFAATTVKFGTEPWQLTDGCFSRGTLITPTITPSWGSGDCDVVLTASCASGCSTFLWSTGERGASITVSPPAYRDYSVYGLNTSACAVGVQVTTVSNPALSSVTIAKGAGDPAACLDGVGPEYTATAVGGVEVAYKWGYRTTTGGAVTDISGETASTYRLAGADFPAAGTYYLVCTVDPRCGDVTVSNELTVTIGNMTSVAVTLTSGAATACKDGLGGDFTATATGGVEPHYQWGYRTVSTTGEVTPLVGQTASTYRLAGGDFPSTGTYYLVCTVSSHCGDSLLDEYETGVTITTACNSRPDPVQYFNITSIRPSSGSTNYNVLQLVAPAASGTYDAVLRWDFEDEGYPATESGGSPVECETGTYTSLAAGAKGDCTQEASANFLYSAFAKLNGGTLHSGRKVASGGLERDWSDKIKWAYSTSATAVSPVGLRARVPGSIDGAVLAVSNDRILHSTTIKSSSSDYGGVWPTAWWPYAMNAPSQARPTLPWLTTTTFGSGGSATMNVAVLGAQDGRVYAFNAGTGALLWGVQPTGSTAIQAAPSGFFLDNGGSYDFSLVLAGTRNSSADNAYYALDPEDGDTIWTFSGGTGAGGSIGIISGQGLVERTTPKPTLYFTSHRRSAATDNTVWCITFDETGPTYKWAVNPAGSGDALGSIEVAPSLEGSTLYVATLAGKVYALDTSNGSTRWSYDPGDGAIKRFIWAEADGNRLYFAGLAKVHCLEDTGSAPSGECTGWPLTIGTGIYPTNPLLVTLPGTSTKRVYVGASDGRVREITPEGTVTTGGSVMLGDPARAKTLGAPTYDKYSNLLYIGSDAGVVYAVELPLGS